MTVSDMIKIRGIRISKYIEKWIDTYGPINLAFVEWLKVIAPFGEYLTDSEIETIYYFARSWIHDIY